MRNIAASSFITGLLFHFFFSNWFVPLEASVFWIMQTLALGVSLPYIVPVMRKRREEKHRGFNWLTTRRQYPGRFIFG